jgi:type IV pilus assembly protein PilC
MAEFQYFGVDKDGKKVSGKVAANSEGDLRMILRGQGIRPLKIAKAGAGSGVKALVKGSGKTVAIDILLTFTRQLHVLLTSGIPLVQALDILSDQAVGREMKDTIVTIKDRVSQGSFLWQSLAAYPRTFSKMYVALIRAGESSGSMDTMLKRLGRYLEDADKMRKLLKSAMIYPVVIVSLGVAIIGGMMVFVVPKFEVMLRSAGQELPMPTQVLINISQFLIKNIILIIAISGFSIYFLLQFLKSPEGRAVSQRLMFNVPLFGPLMQKSGVARFSRTLGTLLGSGINLLDAIDICKTTVDNAVIEDATAKIRGAIESGKTLGQVMNKMTVFPKMSVQMIMVGESTGNLESMLDRVAEFYENEVETLVNGLTKLIEPLILVVLGGAVGGILIAMYLPVFKLAGAAN